MPIAFAIAALTVLVATGCGGSSGDSASGAEGGGSESDYKVAVISVGTEKDHSWSQANFDGAKAGAEKYGAELTVVPNITTPEQYVQQGGAFARRGYDMVLLQNGGATQSAVQLARQFPDTRFGIIWDPTEEEMASLPPNLFTWDARQQDGSFLAGALAGLVTKTGVVASVSGAPFPAITRQLEAFELGVRCAAPNVKVIQKYTGDASFSDAGLARSAAESEIGDGADILFTALDGAVNGVYQSARAANGVYVIAQYFDQASKAPDVILASVLHNLQGVNEDLVKRGVEGTIDDGGHYEYTLKNGDVGTLTDFGQLADVVSPEAQKKLKEFEGKLRSGAIKTPNNEEIAEPGQGADIDPKSLGC
jgi:basic membrane protein A